MDLLILTLLNQTLAHPLLDVLMLAASSLGLALCPAALLFGRGRRPLGVALLAALAASLALALMFQFLALRPLTPEPLCVHPQALLAEWRLRRADGR